MNIFRKIVIIKIDDKLLFKTDVFIKLTRRLFVSLCVLFAVYHAAESQPTPDRKNIVSGGLGYVSHVFVDRHASPLRYANAGPAYSLQYIRNTSSGYHRLTAVYDGGRYTTPDARTGEMFEDFTRIRVEGGYIHRLFSLNEESLLFRGGFHFDNRYTHRRHFYLENRAELFIEYIVALHPVVELYYRLGERHSIRSRVNLSALALIYNSPYAIRGRMQYTFEFFDSFLQWGYLLSYRRQWNDRIEMEIIYSFDYMRHSVPRRYRGASDNFMILFGYRM